MNVSLRYQETPSTFSRKTNPKKCKICDAEGKYKCPTCLVYYCSVSCCKKHREKECEVIKEKSLPEIPPVSVDVEYLTESTVPEERLKLLRNSEMLKDLLSNHHLRTILKTVDEAENPEEIMQKAMQEPIFVEFADACLKTIDPESQENITNRSSRIPCQ